MVKDKNHTRVKVMSGVYKSAKSLYHLTDPQLRTDTFLKLLKQLTHLNFPASRLLKGADNFFFGFFFFHEAHASFFVAFLGVASFSFHPGDSVSTKISLLFSIFASSFLAFTRIRFGLFYSALTFSRRDFKLLHRNRFSILSILSINRI